MAFSFINFSSLKLKLRSPSDIFALKPCEILAISGLILFLLYLFTLNHSVRPTSMFFSPLQLRWTPSERNPNDISPTNISHIVFGLVTSLKTWKPRKPYIDAWWRPNVTRGFLFLDKPPTPELLPWPPTSPPYRVSDDTTKLEKESKHVAPIMIRMVHSILETFRESRDKEVRWFVIGFDDSVFFVDNWVDVLAKYDYTKYINLGAPSESVLSNLIFSFEMGFGGGGIALSYPLAAAMVKELEGCIKRYPYVRSADLITQFCVDEFGVPLTVDKGIHQIDLRGDISGFLSSHPQTPLLSLHHLDFVDPIFPSMDRFQATKHLMKAAEVDQSRLLQQTICYHKPKNWSVSISWGYSVHIYDKIHPRAILKRPLETFGPWLRAKPPMFMFNTRWPCDSIPNVLFFGSVEKKRNQIITTYVRPSPPWYPRCPSIGNRSLDYISKIQVFSSIEKLKEVERSECCEVIRLEKKNIGEVKLRACQDHEIIAQRFM